MGSILAFYMLGSMRYLEFSVFVTPWSWTWG